MRFTIRTFFLVIAIAVFACTSNEKPKSTHKTSNKVKVISNQVLVAEVEGMICKMGCGGAIRKELIHTKAVSRVEIDYQEDSKKQTIKVHYDNQLISKDQIVKKIEKINNNQFKVYPIGTSEINSSTSNSASPSGVKISETSFELPNLIGILSSLITE